MLNGQAVLKKLSEEKSKITKPILSDEQKILLEEKIIEFFEQKEKVNILYYEAGQTKILTGVITKLDPVKRKIFINNKTSLYFFNILDIFQKNA